MGQSDKFFFPGIRTVAGVVTDTEGDGDGNDEVEEGTAVEAVDGVDVIVDVATVVSDTDLDREPLLPMPTSIEDVAECPQVSEHTLPIYNAGRNSVRTA